MVEVLAWLITGITVMFGILPALGSIFTGYGSKYSEDLAVGVTMAMVLVVICAFVLAISWAVGVLTA